MTKSLSVLMPVYNEAECLEDSVKKVLDYLSAASYDYEIVIVDDASTDGSFAIAEALAQNHPFIRLLRHETNRGPCSGLKSGPSIATKPWVLLLPADLAIPLIDIEHLWEARESCDIAVGYIAKGKSRNHARLVQSHGYTALVNLMFGLRLRQVNYVSLYRTSLLQSLGLMASGVAIHAEILIRASRAGFRLAQVPLGYEPRTTGVASGAKPAVIWKTMREIATRRAVTNR